MTRGFAWCKYVDDLGRPFAVRVDRDQADDPCRGWVLTFPGELDVLPRGHTPREAIGIEDDGRKQRTRVATVDAPLWTGVCTQFTIEGTDQLLHVCTVIQLVAETRREPK